MTESEKSHQNILDYNQFLFKTRFEVNKKQIFLVKKLEIQVIVFMIIFTCSSKMIFNSMRYSIKIPTHDCLIDLYVVKVCNISTLHMLSILSSLTNIDSDS